MSFAITSGSLVPASNISSKSFWILLSLFFASSSLSPRSEIFWSSFFVSLTVSVSSGESCERSVVTYRRTSTATKVSSSGELTRSPTSISPSSPPAPRPGILRVRPNSWKTDTALSLTIRHKTLKPSSWFRKPEVSLSSNPASGERVM